MDCHFLLGCALAFTQISVKAMHKLSQRNVKNTLQYNIWPPQTVTQSHCSAHSAYKCISHIASPSQQKVDTFVHLLAPGASQSLWNNREWIGNKFGASEKRRNKFEQIIYIYIYQKKVLKSCKSATVGGRLWSFTSWELKQDNRHNGYML